MRRGVILGAEALRACTAAGAATAFVAAAVAATFAGDGAAAGATAGAGCWADTAATVACSGAWTAATAASLRSALDSAALLGLDKAASIPMASATANAEREILLVIVLSPWFRRRAGPGAVRTMRHRPSAGCLPGNTGVSLRDVPHNTKNWSPRLTCTPLVPPSRPADPVAQLARPGGASRGKCCPAASLPRFPCRTGTPPVVARSRHDDGGGTCARSISIWVPASGLASSDARIPDVRTSRARSSGSRGRAAPIGCAGPT